MAETKKNSWWEGMPWGTIALGIVVQAIFLMFLSGYRGFYYVRNLTYTWSENYFDFMLFLGLITVVIAICAKLGLKIKANTFAILFTFFGVSYAIPHLTARGVALAAIIPHDISWAVDLVPKWWILSSAEASVAYAGGVVDWSQWMAPLAFWSVHYISVLLMCTFLMTIWRRQWITVERLPYPHSMPVYEVINLGKSESKSQIFKERMLWGGLILAIVLYMWDPIRMLTGGLTPRLPLYTIHYASWQAGCPYIDLLASTKGNILLAFSPDMLMGYFILPLDVLLSMWVSIIVFQWLKPMIGIAAGAYPDISAQGWWTFYLNNGWFFWPPNMTLGWGMWIGIGLWCFWAGRDHIRNIIGVLTGKAGAEDDEVISFKWSVTLFVVFAFIWLATMLMAGATAILTIPTWLLYILIFLALGRMKGEFWTGGRPVRLGNSMNWMASTYYYFPTGTNTGGDAQVWNAFFQNIYGNTIDSHGGWPPRANDAYKVSDAVGGIGKHVLIASIIAVVFGIVFQSFFRIIWSYSGWGYTYGWAGNEAGGLSRDLYDGVLGEGGAYAGGVEIYSLGAVIAIILFALKARYVWWPINPVGFAAPMLFWVMPWMFLSVFLAWLWKYLTLKIGGAPLHRKMLMLAIGFIAGYAIINVIEWFVIVFVVTPGARPPPV